MLSRSHVARSHSHGLSYSHKNCALRKESTYFFDHFQNFLYKHMHSIMYITLSTKGEHTLKQVVIRRPFFLLWYFVTFLCNSTKNETTLDHNIHRMQIWRTARSSPGTSNVKARLVGLGCFALTGKSCFVVDLVYFLSPSITVFVFVNTTRTKRDLPQ